MSDLTIKSINNYDFLNEVKKNEEKIVDQEVSFIDVLKNSFEKVNAYQQAANKSIQGIIAGRDKNIHETMLMIERADVSFRLMMQVRNKIIDAYKEIIHMQI